MSNNYTFSDVKPEAALGYFIGDNFYPVHHGEAMELIRKRNRIKRFEVTSMENGMPVTRRHLAEVLPYEMTV